MPKITDDWHVFKRDMTTLISCSQPTDILNQRFLLFLGVRGKECFMFFIPANIKHAQIERFKKENNIEFAINWGSPPSREEGKFIRQKWDEVIKLEEEHIIHNSQYTENGILLYFPFPGV